MGGDGVISRFPIRRVMGNGARGLRGPNAMRP